MEAVARQLRQQRLDDPKSFVALASAIREGGVAPHATVAPRFPNEAAILYDLACYAAQLGHLDTGPFLGTVGHRVGRHVPGGGTCGR